MATISKRGDYQWQAKVRKRGFPPASRTFDTKSQAQKWARLIESEMDMGVFVSRTEAESTTLHEALSRYLNEITPHKKGAKQEKDRIIAWQRHPLAQRFMATIRSVDLATYRDQRLAEGLSASTVRNEINILSNLFNIARKEWGMESLSNPVQNIRKPSPGKGRERRLENGEESRLIEAAIYPIKEMIVLAIETGMRMGELLNMEWQRVNLNKKIVELPDTKNGDMRLVPLSNRAYFCLKNLPVQFKKQKVFPEISNSAVSHRFRKLCKKCEIDDLRFHDLRHEATSRFVEMGLREEEIRAITGHKTLVMYQRYIHLRADEIAKKLG